MYALVLPGQKRWGTCTPCTLWLRRPDTFRFWKMWHGSYHAVLLSEHQGTIFIALEQRLLESKILGNSVENNWLKLLVITNQHHLVSVLERHQRNKTFRLHTHSTLVNYNLTDISSSNQPWTGAGCACAQDYVIFTQLVHTGVFYQLLVFINLVADKHPTVIINGATKPENVNKDTCISAQSSNQNQRYS